MRRADLNKTRSTLSPNHPKISFNQPLVLQASTFGNALPDRAYSFSTEVFAESELITFLNYIAARVVITKPYFVLS